MSVRIFKKTAYWTVISHKKLCHPVPGAMAAVTMQDMASADIHISYKSVK